MGASTQARCRACGYDSDTLIVGGGMREGDLYWPVICNKCEAVTTANFERPRLQCRECRTTRVVRISDPIIWPRSERAIANGLILRKRTEDHLRRMTEERECLVSRYAPEMTSTLSQLNRLLATL